MSTPKHLPAWYDAGNPIAPTATQWATLTESERRAVCAALPIEVEHDFMSEGDAHARAVLESAEMLTNHFGGGGSGPRRFYLGKSLMVYYPGEAGFAPDLFLVFDVEDHDRNSYVVSAEGRPLDFVLEVISEGDAKKDLVRNVARYARLGIPEYFVLDLNRRRLHGFRLPPGSTVYQPLLPQLGRFTSDVLGLHLGMEGRRLRFYVGEAAVPTAREVRERIQASLDETAESLRLEAQRAETEAQRAETEAQRAETEAQRAETEAQRAETEAQRAAEAMQRVAELERRLAQLTRPEPA